MTGLLSMLPAASVLLIAAVRLVELRTKRQTVPGVIQERTSLRFLVLAGHLTLIASVAEWLINGRPFVPAAFVAGWICAVTSFALRWWTIASLGRMWSLHVEIREEHTLVLNGPFRWVRHPTYLSVILEFLALTFICAAWFVLLLVPLLLIPALAYRIRLEETALLAKFPAYADFQRRVPALFPWKGRAGS